MEQINPAAVLTATTSKSQTKPSYSEEQIATALERNGWLRSVAGDHDFNNAVKACKMAFENRRGLFLVGAAGCGKTSLLKVLHKIFRAEPSTFLYCKDERCLGWLQSVPEHYFGSHVFLDDVGCDDIKKEYGNSIDVVGDFIQKYHLYGRGRFFGSSNLGLKCVVDPKTGKSIGDSINQKYGSRVMDRILEMCVCLKFEGGSKRERMMVV